MGDRASISFRNGDQESVAFFSHWDGTDLFEAARGFAAKLKQEAKKQGGMDPLYRLEPATVMTEFIRTYCTQVVTGNYYLGKDGDDGDNSDNGHRIIDLGKVTP